MKYLFLGSFCFMHEEEDLLSYSKCGLQSSIISFQRNMLLGIQANMNDEDSLEIIYNFPIGSWPKFSNRLFIKGYCCQNIRRLHLFNFPIIKQIFNNYQAHKYIKKWVELNADYDKIVIMYDMLTPYLRSLCKISNNKLNKIAIIADLPNEFGYKKDDSSVVAYIKKCIGYRKLKQISKLNYFGLLTRQMAKPLKIDSSRFVVTEGFSNKSRLFTPLEQNTRTLLYTGVVSKVYQLDILVQAIRELDSDIKLWICGSGAYVEELKKICEVDDKITYFGHKTQTEIEVLQSKATVLINPRQNIGEYTKYSFPSKIIEYLSTARPVIAYKLDGIEDAYYNHIYTPTDNSIDSLKITISAILNLPIEELQKKGLLGREFVLSRTDPRNQIKKILDIIDS